MLLIGAGTAVADVPVMVLAFHRPVDPTLEEPRTTVRVENSFVLPASRPPETPQEVDEMLGEVEAAIRRHHPDGERLPVRDYRSINELLEALGDPETAYAPLASPDRLIASEPEHCVFGWFGFNMVGRGGSPVIISTVEGRAGERAGLRPGDKVLKVQGRDAAGRTPTEVCGWVLNARGDDHLSLTVQQPGEAARDIQLFRIVPSQPITPTWKRLPTGVLVLRIPSLDSGMGERVQAAMRDARLEAEREGSTLTGMVVDLRECPGGMLGELVAVAREMIAAGGPLIFVEWKGTRTPYWKEDTGTQLPLAVLVGPGTSGGAEFLAAALRDLARARLVGTPTFGKSSVQRDIPLSSGHSLRLTVGRMSTSRGVRIDAGGLDPDRVETSPATNVDRHAMDPAKDPALASALELLAR